MFGKTAQARRNGTYLRELQKLSKNKVGINNDTAVATKSIRRGDIVAVFKPVALLPADPIRENCDELAPIVCHVYGVDELTEEALEGLEGGVPSGPACMANTRPAVHELLLARRATRHRDVAAMSRLVAGESLDQDRKDGGKIAQYQSMLAAADFGAQVDPAVARFSLWLAANCSMPVLAPVSGQVIAYATYASPLLPAIKPSCRPSARVMHDCGGNWVLIATQPMSAGDAITIAPRPELVAEPVAVRDDFAIQTETVERCLCQLCQEERVRASMAKARGANEGGRNDATGQAFSMGEWVGAETAASLVSVLFRGSSETTRAERFAAAAPAMRRLAAIGKGVAPKRDRKKKNRAAAPPQAAEFYRCHQAARLAAVVLANYSPGGEKGRKNRLAAVEAALEELERFSDYKNDYLRLQGSVGAARAGREEYHLSDEAIRFEAERFTYLTRSFCGQLEGIRPAALIDMAADAACGDFARYPHLVEVE